MSARVFKEGWLLITAMLLIMALMIWPEPAQASQGVPLVTVQDSPNGGQNYTLSMQVLILMTLLTMIPAGVLATTSFTRIIVVLAILRQAMGTQSTPSNQVLLGLAMFLSLFIMSPIFKEMYASGVKPYIENTMTEEQAFDNAIAPLKRFMLGQTRENDIAMFARISGVKEIESPMNTPLSILMPAFVTSELKTAFQIGFLLFIPFVIIDLLVASVLMSMGMMMLSPMIISLPFKIMLFVLIDGWALIVGTLASSFYGVID